MESDDLLVYYLDVEYLGGHPNRAEPLSGLAFHARPSGIYLITKNGKGDTVMHRSWDDIEDFAVGDETEIRSTWGPKVAMFGVLGLLGGTHTESTYIIVTDGKGALTLKVPRVDAMKVKARCQALTPYLSEKPAEQMPPPGVYRHESGALWSFDGVRWREVEV